MARARTAAAEPLPENPPETGKAGKTKVGPGNPPAEHRFKPGDQPNPGGRPKGLAKRVRERVGNDGDAIITSMLAIATNLNGKEKSADIIRANEWLADRGWGKAPIFAPVEEADPLELSERQADEVAAEFDRALDEVGKKRRERTTKK